MVTSLRIKLFPFDLVARHSANATRGSPDMFGRGKVPAEGRTNEEQVRLFGKEPAGAPTPSGEGQRQAAAATPQAAAQ